MELPDYRGGGIVNLMSSLVAGRGGPPTGYPVADALAPDALRGRRRVILLVIDGLGYHYLRRHGAGGTLRRHLRGRLTSVFPSTTATAITTFLTGQPPQQHGLTGWFTYLRELATVMAVLPGRPRYGGAAYGEAGVDPRSLHGRRPLLELLPCRCAVVAPARIAHSDFNRAHLGPASLTTFTDLGGLVEGILSAALGRDDPCYVYAYWPDLDTLGHHEGIEAERTVAHLGEIDRAIARLLRGLQGSDSLLVVTADHGQVDTRPEHWVLLDDHPELAESLVLPLTGEPRVAYCYLRPDRVEHFERYVARELAGRFTCHRSADLLARGVFGLGDPHPQLAGRIGDRVLVARGSHAIKDWLPGERRFRQVGVHGGVSPEEMHVPLIVAQPG